MHSSPSSRRTLEWLSSLSYRTGELDRYLHDIAVGVSEIVGVDWSVVTLLLEEDGDDRDGDSPVMRDRLLASNIDLGEGERVYSIHGTLTATVIRRGCSLAVENVLTRTEYGQAPEGYCAYLGVPLRTASGKTIGTICSFGRQPRSFSPEDVEVAELFAERAATAIDNYQLYQQQCQFNQRLEAEVERRTEQLRQAQAQLVQRERLAAIGEFAATIVHEIRNPLTTVNMGLNYFKRTDLSEPSQARLALALDEASRLERLLGEILLYAKPHALQVTQFDLHEPIGEILESTKDRPNVAPICFTCDRTPLTVRGDRDKLKQVFINLIQNACDASPLEETVTWRVECKGDRIDLQICNGGKPIPAEVLPKLTQPFYTTKASGTGLGLAIVKRIIEAHEGEFSIASNPQTGTTVTVCLQAIES
ncbi:MAG: ATP-binding protein [Cyanobacteriota bacterium]|nr:ATP-binding protein [Cyanobacteriota bacterium]